MGGGHSRKLRRATRQHSTIAPAATCLMSVDSAWLMNREERDGKEVGLLESWDEPDDI